VPIALRNIFSPNYLKLPNPPDVNLSILAHAHPRRPVPR
jgi:hypothetical protein